MLSLQTAFEMLRGYGTNELAILNFCIETENLYHICLMKSLYLVDIFWMFLQCTNQQHTILPSFETPRGCFETSRNAPQTEQTLLISFFTAVLLSQAHQTECLIAIRHSWKPTHTDFYATRQKQDILSILADFFAATWLYKKGSLHTWLDTCIHVAR